MFFMCHAWGWATIQYNRFWPSSQNDWLISINLPYMFLLSFEIMMETCLNLNLTDHNLSFIGCILKFDNTTRQHHRYNWLFKLFVMYFKTYIISSIYWLWQKPVKRSDLNFVNISILKVQDFMFFHISLLQAGFFHDQIVVNYKEFKLI